MRPAIRDKNGAQIYRLTRIGADVSVAQHSHLIGLPCARQFVLSL